MRTGTATPRGTTRCSPSTWRFALAATRLQAGVGDGQFIASMIPHHSGAILMCRQARLQDPELVKLCEDITTSQRREIEQMKSVHARLDTKQ